MIGPDPAQLALGETTATACSDTIGNAASTIAAFENTFKANTPFSLTNPNANYIGNFLAAGANVNSYNNNQGLFDSNYVSPRSVQMNLGIQHEIHRGMVFSADFLRNVETHALLDVDLNHAGDISNFLQPDRFREAERPRSRSLSPRVDLLRHTENHNLGKSLKILAHRCELVSSAV